MQNKNKIKHPNERKSEININIDSNSNEYAIVVDKSDNNNQNLTEEIEEKFETIETIKCDLIINRNYNEMGAFSYAASSDEIQKRNQDFKITLISHFYFSIIIEKNKETEESLKLILNIKDELDDLNTKKEFDIQQLDFICQAEILKMNYNEYQESMKIIEMLEKKEKQNKEKNSSESNDEIFNLSNIDDIAEEKVELLDHNQISEILKNFSYMKKFNKAGKIKILNVDGIYSNYELI